MTTWILSIILFLLALLAASLMAIIGEQEQEIARLRREQAARDAEIVRLRANKAIRFEVPRWPIDEKTWQN